MIQFQSVGWLSYPFILGVIASPIKRFTVFDIIRHILTGVFILILSFSIWFGIDLLENVFMAVFNLARLAFIIQKMWLLPQVPFINSIPNFKWNSTDTLFFVLFLITNLALTVAIYKIRSKKLKQELEGSFFTYTKNRKEYSGYIEKLLDEDNLEMMNCYVLKGRLWHSIEETKSTIHRSNINQEFKDEGHFLRENITNISPEGIIKKVLIRLSSEHNGKYIYHGDFYLTNCESKTVLCRSNRN